VRSRNTRRGDHAVRRCGTDRVKRALDAPWAAERTEERSSLGVIRGRRRFQWVTGGSRAPPRLSGHTAKRSRIRIQSSSRDQAAARRKRWRAGSIHGFGKKHRQHLLARHSTCAGPRARASLAVEVAEEGGAGAARHCAKLRAAWVTQGCRGAGRRRGGSARTRRQARQSSRSRQERDGWLPGEASLEDGPHDAGPNITSLQVLFEKHSRRSASSVGLRALDSKYSVRVPSRFVWAVAIRTDGLRKNARGRA